MIIMIIIILILLLLLIIIIITIIIINRFDKPNVIFEVHIALRQTYFG